MKRISTAIVMALSLMSAGFTVNAVAADQSQPNQSGQSSQSPQQLVQQSVDNLMSKLDNRQQYYRSHPEELKQVVRDNIVPLIDWQYAAASVMGKYFRAATPEQRSRFLNVFRQTLVDTYSQGLVTFDYQSVNVLSSDQDQRYQDQASVDMEVVGTDGQRYPVSYTLRQSNGQWKVVNVVVNGINLGLTFRNQFEQAMQNNNRNIDAVINGWAPEVDLEEGGNQQAQG
ncbi:MlaC/ttg2D family ABC transporter substrate-binding protein [Kushneria aurantia]|uniref:Phospholipid-binding protein MlaC n=1 Tax=Kushneria aurantia TaxID=504092 RepID=A0ABV6G0F0_9GAMM|nr:ABC transporter substrate-binding protein [Kushneria aurantia]